MTTPASDSPSARPGMPGRLAAAVLAVQVLALFAFAVFYVVELVQGASDNASRVVMSIVLILVFAAGLGLLAWGLWRGSPWARTPTIVWQALLLPIAWGLFQSGRPEIGTVVALAAVGGIVAVLMEGRRDTAEG